MMHSVPTEKGSIQGETGSFRPFVTHPLCSLARPAAAETAGRVGSSGGSLPQLRPNICCCAVQAWGRACVRFETVRPAGAVPSAPKVARTAPMRSTRPIRSATSSARSRTRRRASSSASIGIGTIEHTGGSPRNHASRVCSKSSASIPSDLARSRTLASLGKSDSFGSANEKGRASRNSSTLLQAIAGMRKMRKFEIRKKPNASIPMHNADRCPGSGNLEFLARLRRFL
jgi:hypothetical protein